MTGFGQGGSFGDIVAVSRDTFACRAFRAVPNPAKSFERSSARLYDITVVDVDHDIVRQILLHDVRVIEGVQRY